MSLNDPNHCCEQVGFLRSQTREVEQEATPDEAIDTFSEAQVSWMLRAEILASCSGQHLLRDLPAV